MSKLSVEYGFMPYPSVPSSHASSGPLSGLTFAVKDLIDVRGYPTSGGQATILAKSGIKETTAPTVQKLLDSGAELVGKAITEELAFSIVGNNAHFGAPINSANPDRYTGGSSSGSAAVVAAGLVDFALGTDTGGSVRAPASNCGLIGIRPTHGRVSLKGAMDLAPSFDTCGWMTRDMDTFVRIADVLLGNDTSAFAANVRVIEPSDVWAELSPEIARSLAGPREKIRGCFDRHETTTVALESFDQMLTHFRAIQGFEAWATYGQFISDDHPVLGAGIAARFEISRQVTRAQYDAGREFRTRFQDHIDAILQKDGVLFIPTMTEVSPLRGTPEPMLDQYRANTFRTLCIAGHGALPQITLPVADHQGARLGLSLVGPRGSDQSLVRLAKRVMQAFGS
jgi:amidase